MIPHLGMTIYGFVQLTIAVIGIHPKLVGFHGIPLSGTHVLCVRCGRPYRAIGTHSPTKAKENIPSVAYNFNTFLPQPC